MPVGGPGGGGGGAGGGGAVGGATAASGGAISARRRANKSSGKEGNNTTGSVGQVRMNTSAQGEPVMDKVPVQDNTYGALVREIPANDFKI